MCKNMVDAAITMKNDTVAFIIRNRFSDHAAFLSRQSIFKDAGVFFSLPLPHAVWNQTKNARDPDFVRFMEAAFPPQSSVPDSE